MKRIHILLLMTFALLMTQQASAAVTVPWDIGNTFTWGSKSTVKATSNGEVKESTSLSTNIQTTDKIIKVDTVHSKLTIRDANQPDSNTNSTVDYNATKVSNQWKAGFITASVTTYKNNTYITDVSTTLALWFFALAPQTSFVLPDWATINTNLKDFFNSSTVLDYTGIWPFYKTFTLGNLLGNATSYTLMGASSLSDARAALTSTTTTWSFSLDMSNHVYNSYTSNGVKSYIAYDTYKISFSMTYNDQGVLSAMHLSTDTSITHDGITDTYSLTGDIKLGGFGFIDNISSFVPGFELPMAIVAVLAIPVISRKRKSTV